MSAVSKQDEVRRWRGVALELVYESFRSRGSAYSYLFLWSMMQKLGHSVGLNDVIFVCRWLRDMRYLEYTEKRDRDTNKVSADRINITPMGCSLVEGTEEDPNVLVLVP